MKQKAKRIKASTVIIILLLCIIVALSGIIVFQYLKEDDAAENTSELLTYSSENKIDPYGMAGENNILGERITEALQDYIIRNQCDYDINQDFCTFTFKDISYPYGQNPELIVCTDFKTSVVDKIIYSFNSSYTSVFSTRYTIQKIIEYITDYYNDEPFYTCADGSDFVIITNEQYEDLLESNTNYTLDAVWGTDTIMICLSVTNTNKGATCDIAFALNY